MSRQVGRKFEGAAQMKRLLRYNIPFTLLAGVCGYLGGRGAIHELHMARFSTERLEITNSEGQVVMVLSGAANGGSLEVYSCKPVSGPSNQPAIYLGTTSRFIPELELRGFNDPTRNGARVSIAMPNEPAAGEINFFDGRNHPQVLIGIDRASMTGVVKTTREGSSDLTSVRDATK